MTDVHCLDYNGDGSRFATGHSFGRIRIWDSTTLQQVDVYKIDNARAVSWLSFSEDGSRIVAKSDSREKGTFIAVWELESQQASERATFSMGLVAASHDGRILIYKDGVDSKAKLWDVDGRQPWKVNLELRADLTNGFRGFNFSPNGTRVAVAHESWALVYDVLTGKELWSRNHGGRVFSVRFTPDGKHIVTCGAPTMNDHMHMWDIDSGGELARWRVPMREGMPRGESKYGPWIQFLAHSSDGRHWLTAGYNSPVCVWEFKGNAAIAMNASEQSQSPEHVPLELENPPSASVTDDRSIAKQIVEFGGSVQLLGSSTWIWALPEGEIRVQAVSYFRKQKEFGDRHLSLLAQLPDLKHVVFYPNKMTNEGIATLADMENVVENVNRVVFNRVALGPKGLAALAKLKRLESLTLHHTDLTNDDLKLLSKFHSLRELLLSQQNHKKFGPAFLTDEGITHLNTVPNLQKLTLIGDQYTDACLVPVAGLKIEELWLGTRNITDQAIEKLREQRPRLGVTRFKVAEDVDADPPNAANANAERVGSNQVGQPAENARLQPDVGPAAKTNRWTWSGTVPATMLLSSFQKPKRLFGLPTYELWFDADAIDSAGIDLKRQIKVDVKQGTDADHLTAICNELQLEFRVDKNVIRLFPKRGDHGNPVKQLLLHPGQSSKNGREAKTGGGGLARGGGFGGGAAGN